MTVQITLFRFRVKKILGTAAALQDIPDRMAMNVSNVSRASIRTLMVPLHVPSALQANIRTAKEC
jgi:hypothetical protein